MLAEVSLKGIQATFSFGIVPAKDAKCNYYKIMQANWPDFYPPGWVHLHDR